MQQSKKREHPFFQGHLYTSHGMGLANQTVNKCKLTSKMLYTDVKESGRWIWRYATCYTFINTWLDQHEDLHLILITGFTTTIISFVPSSFSSYRS